MVSRPIVVAQETIPPYNLVTADMLAVRDLPSALAAIAAGHCAGEIEWLGDWPVDRAEVAAFLLAQGGDPRTVLPDW